MPIEMEIARNPAKNLPRVTTILLNSRLALPREADTSFKALLAEGRSTGRQSKSKRNTKDRSLHRATSRQVLKRP
jgi:hypothetical protein